MIPWQDRRQPGVDLLVGEFRLPAARLGRLVVKFQRLPLEVVADLGLLRGRHRGVKACW